MFIFLSCSWVQSVMGNAYAQDNDSNDLRLKMGIRTLICKVTQVETNAQWSWGSSHPNQNWKNTTTSLGKSATWNFMKSHRQFLVITNLTHFFVYLFISSLYMFRASQRSSSGDRIVLQFPRDRHTKQSLTQTNHTRWCINTIRSPDDERCDSRNM